MNSDGERLRKPPAATVAIAVYNGERYIARTIESILNQTIPDLEVIVVNDGSTDNTLRIIEHYASLDPRCRIHTGPNRGASSARNTGWELAESEFIAVMDADDICRPQRIERQVAYLREHPTCVAVGSRVMFIDAAGLPIFEAMDCYTHEEIEAALLSRRLAIVHPSAMIRKSALQAIGGYRQDYFPSEDLDLFLRLAEVGRLANLHDVLLEYRQHMSSVSYRQTARQAEIAKIAILDACERRGLAPDLIEKNLSAPASVQTLSEIHRKWAWWALKGGNRRTARKHAFQALLREPVNLESWRVVASALRGR